MPALLFGSISTLADTSELQRRAFNEAFDAHGLGWEWSQEDYRSMLGGNGGAQRISDYAGAQGQDVDAAAVHATKSEIFQRLVADGVEPREGVTETLAAAREQGVQVAFVTTTSPDNIAALLGALEPAISADSFDLIVDTSDVEESKPDPAAYAFALQRLGVSADEAVAVEDNEGGVRAAGAAGIACVAFPNVNTAGGDFSAAVERVDRLDPQQLVGRVSA